MPYINRNDRNNYRIVIREAKDCGINKTGNLNYLVTMLSNIYLEEMGECYSTYNEIIGVLECAKMEMYRRKVAPYEEKAIEKNGDV